MLDTKRNTTQGRSGLAGLAALALGFLALAAPAPAFAQDAPLENGFALQTTIGGRVGVLTVATGVGNNMGSVPLPSNSLEVGLMAGYKFGIALIGLGIEFYDTTVTTSGIPGAMDQSNSTAAFLIGPEFSIAMLRSADHRVELIGDVALHFGHLFTPNPMNTPNLPSNFLLTYQLGPGVRFWPHKHFAIQALTGFSGQLYHVIPPSGTPGNEDISVHGIFGSFGMLGVF